MDFQTAGTKSNVNARPTIVPVRRDTLLSFITCAARMHLRSANRNPATCCRNAFIGSSRSQRLSATRHSCSAPGAAAPLATIHIARPWISGKLLRTTFEEHFPTSYSPSPIGPRREDFSDRSGMFSVDALSSDTVCEVKSRRTGRIRTMRTFTWWIHDPLLKGSGNPTDEDLRALRAQGFDRAVSLLEEDKQPPRYGRASAQARGWSIYSIPIEEGSAPSLEQISEFTTTLGALPPGTKVVVFCESGLGRTSCMGAVYWIAQGLKTSQAIARVNEACGVTDWATPKRQQVLTEYERSMKR